jgi:hypothetical protein
VAGALAGGCADSSRNVLPSTFRLFFRSVISVCLTLQALLSSPSVRHYKHYCWHPPKHAIGNLTRLKEYCRWRLKEYRRWRLKEYCIRC